MKGCLMSLIALLTDYGGRDHYAGVLKGVIAGIAPAATVVDVTHDIAPQDVTSGAFLLWQSWRWFPPGTVFLAVVDPGVGSGRRILVARCSSRMIVAPDNGLITHVYRNEAVESLHSVENHRYFGPELSSTFHGRDILAPTAAHLACGVDPAEFGPAAGQIELLPIRTEAESTAFGLIGQVLHVDRFGTIITNIQSRQLADLLRDGHSLQVLVNDVDLGQVRKTFSDVGIGDPLALVGGGGLLEIAVHRGRAIDRFGPESGVIVQVVRSTS
jgi:hypothetical protein